MSQPPQSVGPLTVRYYGPPGGNASWYYWVQTVYPGGYTALSPFGVVNQSQPSLNPTMFNVVSWVAVVGATGYMVWRTPTSTPPTTGPYMLAQIDASGTSITDNGVNWQITNGTVVVTSIGGSQTPWTSNIDAAGYSLGNVQDIGVNQAPAYAGNISVTQVTNANQNDWPGVTVTSSNPNYGAALSLVNDLGHTTTITNAGSLSGGAGNLANDATIVSTQSKTFILENVSLTFGNTGGQTYTLQRDGSTGLFHLSGTQPGSTGYQFDVTLPNGTVATGLEIWCYGNTTDIGLAPTAGNVGIGLGVGGAPSYQLQLSTDSAAKPGTNTWTIASDIRLKRDVRPFTEGLETLQKVEPIRYRYNGQAGLPEIEGIGIDARAHKEIIPDCITTFKGKLDDQETDLYASNSHALTFMLVNAVRELNERLKKLERGKI